MVSSEDEETQKKGVVKIIYGLKNHTGLDRKLAWTLPSFARSMPLRIVGVHFCYDNPLLLPAAAAAKLAANTFTRLRSCTHYGK